MKSTRCFSILLALVMVFTLLPVFSVPALADGDVTIDSTNFPDEVFRNYITENFDVNGNGNLSVSERDSVTSIRVNHKGISSLEGIEFFPALEYLDCGYNNLTSVDVSHNTALLNLALANNNLTSLDVSHNTALVCLLCWQNNLTYLDVSHNTALKYLECGNNDLASLDVSRNTALVSLLCNANSLASLNISYNTALTALYCECNNLTSLDVSHNTALTELYCWGNSLTSLDVRNNAALTELCSHSNRRAVHASGGIFDLSTLPGFDVAKASDWNGGTVSGSTLTVPASGEVTYTYDCGNENSEIFTLDVTVTDVTVKYITSVSVTITAPKAGAKPDYNPVLPTGAHYYSSTDFVSSTSINDVMWFDETAERYLDTTDTFIAGHAYTVRIDLTPETNYEFEADLPGTLNNLVADVQLRDSEEYDYARLRYTFPALPTAKPTIIGQPKSTTVVVGKTATFTVTANGADSYQWYYRKPGETTWNKCTKNATSASYSVSTEARHNGYAYRCKVKNGVGTTTSKAATLTVLTKPSITAQPASVSVAVGQTATFTVAASGDALSYQWYFKKPGTTSWSKCKNSGTSASYSVVTEARHDGYQYRCKVTNAAGSATSSAATLTVTTVTAPAITTQPGNKSVVEGKTATFKVVASGEGLSYLWYYQKPGESTWNKCKNSGTSASYSVTTEARHNGYHYQCIITNEAGSVTSNAAKLTVKPGITTQPASVTVTKGQTATFTVVATGTGLTYQWYYQKPGESTWNACSNNGASATYSVVTAARHNGYSYRCKVTNSGDGAVYTSVATLTVN